MWQRFVLCWLWVLIAGPIWVDNLAEAQQHSDKSVWPAEEFQAIETEANAAHQNFVKRYHEAKGEEERKIEEEYDDQLEQFSERMLTLAKKNPDAPAAVDALSWVVRTVSGKQADEALDALAERAESDKLAPVCEVLARMGGLTPKTERLLRAVIKQNKNHKVQGIACLSLAQALKQTSEWGEGKVRTPYAGTTAEKLLAEAEQLYERVVEEFSDVKGFRGSLADTAKGELFEMRHLTVGMIAPEIEGEDLDDKPLKLSDLRGKVVLLVFWGHW